MSRVPHHGLRSPGPLAAPDGQPPRDTDGVLAGLNVLTLEGAIPAEYLGPGDRIVTRDRGSARLLAVDRVALITPVYSILPASFGASRPDRRVLLPASARLHIRDWRAMALFGRPEALIEVSRLADGDYIALQPARQRTLLRLIFETPQILFADGLAIAGQVAEPAQAASP